jgi:hypothetical protein
MCKHKHILDYFDGCKVKPSSHTITIMVWLCKKNGQNDKMKGIKSKFKGERPTG